MKERLRFNLESRLSGFEEEMPSVLAVFKQKEKSEMADSRPWTACSVIASVGNTSRCGPHSDFYNRMSSIFT